MNAITVIVLIFSALGAIDLLIGNKFGLGEEFERAFTIFRPMALSMIGMIVIAPAIGVWLLPLFDGFYDLFGIDPSIIPSSILANDMGGTALSLSIAKSETVGKFNALVVSSMMGCIVSFTIPFTMGMVKKERHRELFLGLICGIAAIPFGCFAAGLVSGLSISEVFFDLLPIIILSLIVGVALIVARNICIKIFGIFGVIIKSLSIIGLVLSVFTLLTGVTLNQHFDSFENAAFICAYGCVTLSGMLPAMFLLSKVIKKPLGYIGKKLKIDDTSSLAMLGTLVTLASTFADSDKMNEKGLVMNAAFAATGAYVFGGHLAFTMIYDTGYALPMIVGKLVSGVFAIIFAHLIYKEKGA